MLAQLAQRDIEIVGWQSVHAVRRVAF